MSRNQRSLVLVLAVVVLVAGFFIARSAGDDDDDGASSTTPTAAQTQVQAEPAGDAGEKAAKPAEPEPAPEPKPPLIVVRGGEPVDGVAELRFDKGDEIDFRVRSDAPDAVHVHGYDIEKELPAGQTVRMRFAADIDGRFEVELHESGALIAQLEVQP